MAKKQKTDMRCPHCGKLIEFKTEVKPIRRVETERNKGIRNRRMRGETLESIGKDHGLSRERIRQLTNDVPNLRLIRTKIDRRILPTIRSEKKHLGVARRFWNHVLKAGPEECWLWTSARAGGRAPFNQYGHVSIPYSFDASRHAYAHHLSFYLENGRWPAQDLWVLHRCNNSLCVNPAHLYEGTPKQNIRDAVAVHGHWHSKISAKLSVEDVPRIRLLKGILSAREMAWHVEVGEGQIHAIWAGRSWKTIA